MFSQSPLSSPKQLIDQKYIDRAKRQIATAYPHNSKFSREYPKEDLASAYVYNHEKDDRYKRYNPFSLRLPYQLEGYDRLYNAADIENYVANRFHDEPLRDPLTKELASTTYFNFLEQYNFLYLHYLQAINGDESSLKSIKELLSKNVMFDAAEIRHMKFLNRSIVRYERDFLLALLAYSMLNIVFSKNEYISSAARVQALDIVRNHFDLDAVSKAFERFNLGYYAYYKEAPVFDLIPKKFVKHAKESGGTLQHIIFLENEYIKSLFSITQSGINYRIDFAGGFNKLLAFHPEEMLQIMHGFLLIPEQGQSFALVFSRIVNLGRFDAGLKEKIFGSRASFLSADAKQSRAEATADWTMGAASFGQEETSADGMIARIRLLEKAADSYKDETTKAKEKISELGRANTVLQLEVRMLKSELTRVKAQAQNLGELYKSARATESKGHNDPKGYFAFLGLHPSMLDQPELFEANLKIHKRYYEMQYHPDKGGTNEQFVKLQEAYECLSNAEKRNEYLTSAQKNPYAFGFSHSHSD